MTDVREELGRGIRGTVAGRDVVVGSPTLGRAHCRARTTSRAGSTTWSARRKRRSRSRVDGAIVAVAGLADPIRPDARACARRAAELGWRVEILSGDDPRVVRAGRRRARPAGDRCAGGVTPEGKRAACRSGARARARSRWSATASTMQPRSRPPRAGIAVSGAAEIAIEAADVLLRSPSIEAIAATAAGARATLATIRRSLKFSLAYNITVGAARDRRPDPSADRRAADAGELALGARQLAALARLPWSSAMTALYIVLPLALLVAAGAVVRIHLDGTLGTARRCRHAAEADPVRRRAPLTLRRRAVSGCRSLQIPLAKLRNRGGQCR